MNHYLTDRVCPIVLRNSGDGTCDILVFEHPLAGVQLVKGRIEPNETPAKAASRELREESGLQDIDTPEYLLSMNELPDTTGVWHFFLCKVQQRLPETWIFETTDDGGHRFRFFWHRFDEPISAQCHPLYNQVLSILQPILEERSQLSC